MSTRAHWERVYASKPFEELGWYKAHLVESLELIAAAGVPLTAPLVDVGAGASTLAQDLLERGHSDITVVDLSATALATARERLGPYAGALTWINGDVTRVELPTAHYALWHDRAVFHFLTEATDRERYVERMRRALAPGGFVLVGTFAVDAPPRCSGLPVERYDGASLQRALGSDLTPVAERRSVHVTPGGVEQPYVYCLLEDRTGG